MPDAGETEAKKQNSLSTVKKKKRNVKHIVTYVAQEIR